MNSFFPSLLTHTHTPTHPTGTEKQKNNYQDTNDQCGQAFVFPFVQKMGRFPVIEMGGYKVCAIVSTVLSDRTDTLKLGSLVLTVFKGNPSFLPSLFPSYPY